MPAASRVAVASAIVTCVVFEWLSDVRNRIRRARPEAIDGTRNPEACDSRGGREAPGATHTAADIRNREPGHAIALTTKPMSVALMPPNRAEMSPAALSRPPAPIS